jgi:hypothetical protein
MQHEFNEEDWKAKGKKFELKIENASVCIHLLKVLHDDGTERGVVHKLDEKFLIISSNNRFKGKVLLIC